MVEDVVRDHARAQVVRNIVLCEEEARKLPSEMDFDKGYNHLTKEQRVYLKKKLAPEGSFFMKGKYPKTGRTPPVVIDVRGAPPKASDYQRLSEKEQEVVNQYVENLVAADVVEPCSGVVLASSSACAVIGHCALASSKRATVLQSQQNL